MIRLNTILKKANLFLDLPNAGTSVLHKSLKQCYSQSYYKTIKNDLYSCITIT